MKIGLEFVSRKMKRLILYFEKSIGSKVFGIPSGLAVSVEDWGLGGPQFEFPQAPILLPDGYG